MTSDVKRAVLTVKDFKEWARIGTTRIYEEIAAGRLRTFKIGRRTMIATSDAEAWLAGYRDAHSHGTVEETAL